MTITINDKRKIFAIQEEFNDIFPYLKLEFLVKPNTAKAAHPAKYVKSMSTTLADCRTVHESGDMTINPSMTIGDLKTIFANVYGIGVEVYSKMGTKWVPTTLTQGHTLEEHNQRGEELSKAKLSERNLGF